MNYKTEKEISTVRLNLELKGDPAKWLHEWKMRGLVKSNSDAVRSAFRVFQDLITERDLKQDQLERSRR